MGVGVVGVVVSGGAFLFLCVVWCIPSAGRAFLFLGVVWCIPSAAFFCFALSAVDAAVDADALDAAADADALASSQDPTDPTVASVSMMTSRSKS